jgi:CRP-like cAMP-binding protein
MFNRQMSGGHLKAGPLVSACSVKQLEELARPTETVTVSAGSPVVKEGSVGREFFVISAGRARVSRRGRKLAILGPGDFFGELSLLVNQPRNATVTAIDDLDLVLLNRPDFVIALDDVPGLAAKLVKGLAVRLSEVEKKAY